MRMHQSIPSYFDICLTVEFNLSPPRAFLGNNERGRIGEHENELEGRARLMGGRKYASGGLWEGEK